MKFRLGPCLLLSIMAIALETRGQDAKTELDKLQGKWSVTAMERGEKSAPKDIIDNIVITFAGDKMTLGRTQAGAKSREYAIKLDPTKNPKAIDLIPADGASKGKTVAGIYRFDGNDLKICMPNTDSQERPKEFKSVKDTDLIVMSLTPAKK